MALSIHDLGQAREAAAGVLDDLGLEAYVFDVEPGETAFRVHVEYRTTAGWQTRDMQVAPRQLADAAGDARSRARLAEQWGDWLDLPVPGGAA